MSVLRLASRKDNLVRSIAERPRLWLAITFGFPVLFYGIMLVTLMIRFQAVPNYFEFYNWFGNVAEIIRSTPSVSDMLPIIGQEWLFETGHMNYDYGHGISEWSLYLVPPKILAVLLLGAGTATMTSLMLFNRRVCQASALNGASATGGLGAGLVGLTNVTISWVVCCSTPNWVAGLSILGLGVSTSFMLEPFGPYLEWGGYLFMLAAIFYLAGANSDAGGLPKPAAEKTTAGKDAGFSNTVMGASR